MFTYLGRFNRMGCDIVLFVQAFIAPWFELTKSGLVETGSGFDFTESLSYISFDLIRI